MKQEFTNKPRDMQWLRCTHLRRGNVRWLDGKLNMAGPIRGFLSAIIYGNDDCPDRIDVYPFANPDVGAAFCMTFKLDDDGLYRETLPEAESKVFEVTGVGYDGGDYRTDGHVLWVVAPSHEYLMAALKGIKMHDTPMELMHVTPSTPGVDLTLPADLPALRQRLQSFLNVKEAGK